MKKNIMFENYKICTINHTIEGDYITNLQSYIEGEKLLTLTSFKKDNDKETCSIVYEVYNEEGEVYQLNLAIDICNATMIYSLKKLN